MTTAPTAGVVGLGEIGGGVARSIARAGLALVVCDVRQEATAAFTDCATIAGTPAALGATSDVVLVAVLDDAQVEAVVLGDEGVLRDPKPGSIVVVLSTIGPDTVRGIGEQAEKRGVGVLDCGVSGGPGAAAEGSLVSMLGGNPEVIERARPVLEAFSERVVHMGPLGAGLQAKLARNLVQYASWLAAYEAQVLAEAAGIELAKLAEVIRESDKKIGGASTLMFRKTVAPFGPDDDAGLIRAMQSAAALAHKDLRAAVALAERLGLELPLATMTEARADAIFGVGPDTHQEHP